MFITHFLTVYQLLVNIVFVHIAPICIMQNYYIIGSLTNMDIIRMYVYMYNIIQNIIYIYTYIHVYILM